MSAIRIVCTIGPATNNAKAIQELVDAGMSVARLNGSHSDLDWHADAIRTLRAVAPNIPILLDIPGRKIRTGLLQIEPRFNAGDPITFTTDGDNDGSLKIPVSNVNLHKYLSVGDTIVADDGTLSFSVVHIEGRDINCRAENAGQLKSRKGINVPHVSLKGDLITERDRNLIDFVREHEIDFVGISFVESAAHVAAIRALIGSDWPRIVSKVENRGGIENLEEIVEASDAIMIDRGDLSVETSLYDVALMQRQIIEAGIRHAKPVIVATEMLHSMIHSPFPTKAEVSDITHAVLDGCAATMLSGETAVGVNPSAAVQLMRRVVDAAERYVQTNLNNDDLQFAMKAPEAMAEATALIGRRVPITKIVVFTRTGYAARMIASRRPKQPILAVSDNAMAARSFNLIAGTTGFFMDSTFARTSTDHIADGLERLWRASLISDDDMILVTGLGYPNSGNRFNLIQVHNVMDLIETLGWRQTMRRAS